MSKLWGGRFAQTTDQFVEQFTASIHYDARLYPWDIRASIVHCRMLARQQIIRQEECDSIVHGLQQVQKELEAGQLPFRESLEDIHMHVESRLKELIGPVAGKLHTARSRNDQVATDLRLYLRDQVDQLQDGLRRMQGALLDLANQHVETILPGMTHLQNAQPVSLAHHLLAYMEMLQRDRARLRELRFRINQLPLGAAALAGTPFPIDRHWVAEQLGFDGICRNSMDAVSDRDFVIELAAACSLIMLHFSRFAEELVLWSSPLLSFIELPDGFCTGSSIMPQKKNPDVPELVRGKSGRVFGHLFSLLTLMKALPLSYNRDMQEDKEPIFDTLDTVQGSLRALTELIPGISVHKENMLQAAAAGFTTATDLADYLVGKNIPFREAHEIAGRMVRLCIEQNCTLDNLPLTTMQQIDARIDSDVHPLLTLSASVNARRSAGGTAFAAVREALAAFAKSLESESMAGL
ncbi:argininosuccinate lyase [Candidatus Magnetaquicoccus inordinatus]|uniref:argininosuccinate lyase n=1 Tax=Candidatus Magnetaquicoccus inordinatus TaxID=2496818 RepID=UPI00102CE817|nr:argininosuccinate lyase [Candidatus Magnetaquicoccus inordinatus]